MFFSGAQAAFSQASAIQCKVPISEKVCYTLSHESRDCIDPPKELAVYKLGEQLELIFDVAPSAMQQTMCDLDALFVAKEFEGHGSGFLRNTEMYLGWDAVVRMQRTYSSLIETSFSRYALGANFFKTYREIDPGKWKFTDASQLYYDIEYTKPRIKDLNYALANLIFHELAHLMESHPRLSILHRFGFFGCNSQLQRSSNYILLAADRILKGYVFTLKHYPAEGQDSSLLRELEQSNYSTPYAMANAAEDFAEVMSEYIMFEHFGVNFRIRKGDEILFDRRKQFQNENMQAKLDIVKLVLALPSMAKKKRRALRLDRKLCRGMFDPKLMTQLN
ncbi:hypothetical protein [Maritalea sp.]|uniref:hypothetical protein n=1 Tax=Maritalea sp. TaxID=2003361 RepID=UPI003EFB19C1